MAGWRWRLGRRELTRRDGEGSDDGLGRLGPSEIFLSSCWVLVPRPTKGHQKGQKERSGKKNSVAGTRTRVSRVRAEYPNQLDYNGFL
jgi:hypothetical protein